MSLKPTNCTVALVQPIRMLFTFIVLHVSADWLWRVPFSNLIHSLHTELIHVVLSEVFNGCSCVCDDLPVGHVKFSSIMSHLLNVVTPNGTPSVSTWGFPRESDGGLGPLCVMQLLWGRRCAWNDRLEYHDILEWYIWIFWIHLNFRSDFLMI